LAVQQMPKIESPALENRHFSEFSHRDPRFSRAVSLFPGLVLPEAKQVQQIQQESKDQAGRVARR
jgi:hypothetical protein